jgi:hypothetical protein
MRYVFLLQFIISSWFVKGQTTFQTLIENPEWSITQVSQDLVESPTGDIYALSDVAFTTKDVRLIKMNRFGLVQWDTIYDFATELESFPKLVNAHDGGVIVASTSYSFPQDDQDGIQDILIWKINELGEIVWQKVIAVRSFHSLIATSDGNYIVLGNHYSSSLDLLVTKFNDKAEILWQKIIARPLDDGEIAFELPVTIKEINSFIYISALLYNPLVSNWYDGLLYQFDLDGNINWEIRVPSIEEDDARFIRYIFRFNGQYFFITRRYIDYVDTYTFSEKTGEYRQITDSIRIDIGDMLVQNVCGTGDELIVLNEITEKEFVLKKYNHLDSAAYYEIPFDAPEGGFKKIIESIDGGYLVLSSTWDEGTVVVSKTDCLGNVAFWSDECNSKIPEGQEILLLPNPVQDVLTIETKFNFSEVSVINPLGEITIYKNECDCNRKLLDLSDLSAGVYIVVIPNGAETITQKFVKI